MKLTIEMKDGNPLDTTVYLDGKKVPALTTLELSLSVKPEPEFRNKLHIEGHILSDDPKSTTRVKLDSKLEPVTFSKTVYLPTQNMGEALVELRNNIEASDKRRANDSKKSIKED